MSSSEEQQRIQQRYERLLRERATASLMGEAAAAAAAHGEPDEARRGAASVAPRNAPAYPMPANAHPMMINPARFEAATAMLSLGRNVNQAPQPAHQPVGASQRPAGVHYGMAAPAPAPTPAPPMVASSGTVRRPETLPMDLSRQSSAQWRAMGPCGPAIVAPAQVPGGQATVNLATYAPPGVTPLVYPPTGRNSAAHAQATGTPATYSQASRPPAPYGPVAGPSTIQIQTSASSALVVGLPSTYGPTQREEHTMQAGCTEVTRPTGPGFYFPEHQPTPTLQQVMFIPQVPRPPRPQRPLGDLEGPRFPPAAATIGPSQAQQCSQQDCAYPLPPTGYQNYLPAPGPSAAQTPYNKPLRAIASTEPLALKPEPDNDESISPEPEKAVKVKQEEEGIKKEAGREESARQYGDHGRYEAGIKPKAEIKPEDDIEPEEEASEGDEEFEDYNALYLEEYEAEDYLNAEGESWEESACSDGDNEQFGNGAVWGQQQVVLPPFAPWATVGDASAFAGPQPDACRMCGRLTVPGLLCFGCCWKPTPEERPYGTGPSGVVIDCFDGLLIMPEPSTGMLVPQVCVAYRSPVVVTPCRVLRHTSVYESQAPQNAPGMMVGGCPAGALGTAQGLGNIGGGQPAEIRSADSSMQVSEYEHDGSMGANEKVKDEVEKDEENEEEEEKDAAEGKEQKLGNQAVKIHLKVREEFREIPIKKSHTGASCTPEGHKDVKEEGQGEGEGEGDNKEEH